MPCPALPRLQSLLETLPRLDLGRARLLAKLGSFWLTRSRWAGCSTNTMRHRADVWSWAGGLLGWTGLSVMLHWSRASGLRLLSAVPAQQSGERRAAAAAVGGLHGLAPPRPSQHTTLACLPACRPANLIMPLAGCSCPAAACSSSAGT